MKLSRLHILDNEDDESQEAHPLGIRSLRESGGSVVVTIPPKVLEAANMKSGDDVVLHVAEDSITLANMPEQESD
jgi:hypothetical protein